MCVHMHVCVLCMHLHVCAYLYAHVYICMCVCTSAFINPQLHTIIFNPILIIPCSCILSTPLCLTTNYNLRVLMAFPVLLLGIRGLVS